jgi:hypothetical protein
MIFAIIDEDPGLVKKSARWVPKSAVSGVDGQKNRDFGGICKDDPGQGQEPHEENYHHGRAGSMHTPETKMQSKQQLKKGKPGPIMAKVASSRTKQIVSRFFDNKGVIYTNHIQWGATVHGG